MDVVKIENLNYLQIGVQGENDSVDIPIDMTSWVEKYPDITLSFGILFKPYNSATPATPVAHLEYDGDTHILTWTVDAGCTQVVGVGYTEVQATNSTTGLIKKTRVVPTSVENSVTGGASADPPTTYASWVEEVLQAASDSEAYGAGTRNGSDVGSDDPAWHNNAKYYATELEGGLPAKADKVTGATNGNFAALDSNGNLTDSGHKHSDYVTDISGKADKANTVLTTTLSRGRKALTPVGDKSLAFGDNVKASGEASSALGYQTEATNLYSHAQGTLTKSSGIASHAENRGTEASGTGSHSEGNYAKASGYASHAEGNNTEANHKSQHAGGEFNVPDPSEATADNRGDFAEIIGNGTDNDHRSNARALDWDGNERLKGDLYVGCNADSSGGSKVAKASEVTQKADKVSGATSGNFAALDGNGNLTDSGHKHSDYITDISGKADKADTVLTSTLSRGRKPNTTTGTGSFAFGNTVEASGSYSFAENQGRASGSYSHAEGTGAASGHISHAEGALTTASGYYSHAEGDSTTASGSDAHAEGYCTTANHKSQHVSGEYNVEDPSSAAATARGNYAEIIGNGTGSSAKSNARTLDWDGNERLKGDLYVGCNANSTGGTKLVRATAEQISGSKYRICL